MTSILALVLCRNEEKTSSDFVESAFRENEAANGKSESTIASKYDACESNGALGFLKFALFCTLGWFQSQCTACEESQTGTEMRLSSVCTDL